MTTRREMLLLLGGSAVWAQAKPRQPNFIVIFADDLGYGDLACYGSPRNATPHLDRMAAEGALFTDFYVPMPFCAPSRSALLTGRYPFRTTITGNPAPDSGINELALPPEERTIPEVLKPLGYATSIIGKWHLGHQAGTLPRSQGFDEYYGIPYSNDMRPVQLVENEKVVEYPVAQSELTRKYTERALAFLDRNKARPFFLYLPHAMPHKPLAASQDFYTKGDTANLYAAVMRELDWSVGQILATLKALGLEDNTLVLFTSDNGATFGGSTGGLRGMKGSPFEGGVRVPLLARWPKRIPAGLRTSEVAGVIDFLPTIAALAGAALPAGRTIDGKNIFGLMTQTAARSPHEALFVMSGANLSAVRMGRWKLHVRKPGPGLAGGIPDPDRYVDPRGPDGVTILAPYEQARPSMHPGVVTGDAARETMLFDLATDPAEQHDVSASHPDIVAKMKEVFARMEKEVGPPRVERGWGGVKVLKGGELRYDRVVEKP
jgi:arylsulfatase A-like enzyme